MAPRTPIRLRACRRPPARCRQPRTAARRARRRARAARARASERPKPTATASRPSRFSPRAERTNNGRNSPTPCDATSERCASIPIAGDRPGDRSRRRSAETLSTKPPATCSRAGKLKDADPLQLRQLGVYLTEQGDMHGRRPSTKRHWPPATSQATRTCSCGGTGPIYCLATGNHKRAAECFARLLDAVEHPEKFGLDDATQGNPVPDPSRARPTSCIGECFLAADRPEDAKAAFDKAEKLAPDKALRQFNLARVYLKTGKPAEALAAMESSFAEHLAGEGIVPYETLAKALNKLGKSGELIGRLEKLRAADPPILAARLFSGVAISGCRQARQGRIAVPRTAQDETHDRRLSRIGRSCIGKASGSTPCWRSSGEAVEKIGVLETLWTPNR